MGHECPKRSLIFPLVSTLHFFWAAMLVSNHTVVTLSPFSAFVRMGMDCYDLAFLFVIASILSCLPRRNIANPVIPILLLVPQQILALICAISAVMTMSDGFEDIRVIETVLAVQFPVFLIGVFHMAGMLRYGGWTWSISRLSQLFYPHLASQQRYSDSGAAQGRTR